MVVVVLATLGFGGGSSRKSKDLDIEHHHNIWKEEMWTSGEYSVLGLKGPGFCLCSDAHPTLYWYIS